MRNLLTVMIVFVLSTLFSSNIRLDALSMHDSVLKQDQLELPDQQDDSANELREKATTAFAAGRYQVAFEAAAKLCQREPDNLRYQLLLGDIGFAAGKFDESIAAFDSAIRIRPDIEPQLWQRGLALYYADRFADGVKQFETHQTVNSQDVENVVWHLLCAAQVSDVEEARKNLIPISKDSRVPMSEIYEMFAGRMTVEDVRKAARKTTENVLEDSGRYKLQLYYAYLYIGLYHEMLGDKERTIESLKKAVEVNPLGKTNFMGQVARVHLECRRKAAHAPLSSTELPSTKLSSTKSSDTQNTVIVMGMIHGSHRQPGPYDIDHLKELIRKINPDYVLTEIPPDRLDEAAKQFRETGRITESRVKVFPEYTDALFPLTTEMQFEIVPCAAWTKSMNDSRRATLQKLRTTHAEQYAEMETAQARASENITAIGPRNDPVTIHTQQYDDFVKTGMGPYDRYFNDLIGEGGWTNINAGHYGLIEKALDQHTGKGKRFLITFGSWHKYYIKEQLLKRADIQLVPMSEYLSDAESPTSWPRFRLNGSGNNAYGHTEIQTPVVQWKYTTGDIIESSPAVVDGVVYVGGHANRMHAINQETGELLWKFDVGGWVRATPSIVDGVVYLGADDNKFYALDAKTGAKKWEFDLGEGGEQSSPAIADGVVYFGAFDNHVYALDAKTGDQIWKFDAGASMLSSPALDASSLYIGTYAGKLFSINRKTGEENWVFKENDKPIFSSPVVNRELVTFGSYDQHVYGLNVTDGSVRWKTKTNGEIFSSPTMVGETIYIGSNDKHLYALDATEGAQIWKADLNGAVFSSPAATDQTIYVGSSDGHLYAINRQDGSRRWRHLVGNEIRVWTSPIAIQGKIYFGSHGGDVIALMDKPKDSSK